MRSIRIYEKLLNTVKDELTQCINVKNRQNFRQCNFKSSRTIYKLFTRHNLIVYTAIYQQFVGLASTKPLVQRLDSLLLAMFQMSNLCNESYFLRLNYPMYTCRIRFFIKKRTPNVKHILLQGYNMGLQDLLNEEECSGWTKK